MPAGNRSSIEEWNWRLANLRKSLRGWSRNIDGLAKRIKAQLVDNLDILDKQAETVGLSVEARNLQIELKQHYNLLAKEDAIKWFQRAKSNDLKLGDSNTKYFMNKASGRRRKNKIFLLFKDDDLITGDTPLLDHATEYYKSLFGPSDGTRIRAEFEFPYSLSDTENKSLIRDFSFEEIKAIVFSLGHNKVPGPDGFPREFYQFFGDVIKCSLKRPFDDFSKGVLDFGRLNFGTITLLPKGEDADRIQRFRPICLMNVSLKILTKGAYFRLTEVAEKIVDKTQTALMKNRFIMEGILIMHEVLHEVHKKKLSSVLFKVDFEKTYDNINWAFLYNVMLKKGFDNKWNDWIFSIITSGKVNIKLNDCLGPYFNTHRGVRQGDPLSPLLFNLAVDALSVMIRSAQEKGLIKGITPHLWEGGIAILQYADDTVFLLEEGDENARNLKFILCLFEQLSGLKINFLESEVFYLGGCNDNAEMYSEIFTCQLGVLPIKYLGIPIDKTRLANKHWKFLEDKMEKRLGGWQGKLLSIGGRATLLNSCLSSIPFYMLSFYRIPRGVCKRLDYFRS